MNNIRLKLIFLLLLFNLFSCETNKNSGLLYVADKANPDYELISIKILNHTYNQSSAENIISEFKNEISYKGYSWKEYNIPVGNQDIYVEYCYKGQFRNEREEVFIPDNKSQSGWIALWFTDNSDNRIKIINGKGSLNINDIY